MIVVLACAVTGAAAVVGKKEAWDARKTCRQDVRIAGEGGIVDVVLAAVAVVEDVAVKKKLNTYYLLLLLKFCYRSHWCHLCDSSSPLDPKERIYHVRCCEA